MSISRIAVVNIGQEAECFASSSLIKGLHKEFEHAEISWIVKNNCCKQLFSNNKNIEEALTLYEMYEDEKEYDLVINLSPEFNLLYLKGRMKEGRGFSFDGSVSDMYNILYGKENTNMNIFQVYYRIAGLSWRGEGCDISYYPKSKNKKGKIGIAVADARLRGYLLDKLELDNMKKWIIPYKKNVFKKMDELNKCGIIITDDFLTMNIAVYLRKYVHFLRMIPLHTRPEFFGNGQVHTVPSHILS